MADWCNFFDFSCRTISNFNNNVLQFFDWKMGPKFLYFDDKQDRITLWSCFLSSFFSVSTWNGFQTNFYCFWFWKVFLKIDFFSRSQLPCLSRAVLNVLQKRFPEVPLHGCFFLWKQAIGRKLEKFRFSQQDQENFLKCVDFLSVLNQHQIAYGLEFLEPQHQIGVNFGDNLEEYGSRDIRPPSGLLTQNRILQQERTTL